MIRKNKTNLLILGIIIALSISFGFVIFVQGHSPSGMSLVYHSDTETLDVTITHSVSNLQTHYIEAVDIYLNDILNQTEDYTSQPSNTFTYSYSINATLGDAIKVTASCNQGGSITETLTVGDNPTANATLNGLCVFLIGLPLLGMISKHHNRKQK
jgi:hypothetical protein